MEATIAEILRINPVGPMALPHVSLTDTELCGYTIKKVICVLTILLSDLCDNKHHGAELFSSNQSFSAGEETPCVEPEGSLLYSQQLHTGPVLRQMNPAHTLLSHFIKVHCNITLPTTSGFSELSLFFRHSIQYPVCIFVIVHACHTPNPSHAS